MIIGAIVFIAWLGAWFFLSGASQKSWNYVEDTVIETAAEQGFRVENILIEGRINTDLELLRALINTDQGDPLLDFDPEAVQPLIQKISWVRNAIVLRRMPDTIHVMLDEYEPYALWQNQGKVVVIGDDGTVLTDKLREDFSDFIILTGQNAPLHVQGLVELLNAEPLIKNQVEGAIWVGDRRWDLNLKNGKKVSLPATDIGFAIRRLAVAQEEDDIFSKDIQVIDLRETDRIIVESR